MRKNENIDVTTLPPMLSQEEEQELLKKLSNKDNLEVKNKLIEGNYKLLLSIVNKYEDENVDDLIQIGLIGMLKAVNTYELNKKIKFSDYISKCIESEIIVYQTKCKEDNS